MVITAKIISSVAGLVGGRESVFWSVPGPDRDFFPEFEPGVCSLFRFDGFGPSDGRSEFDLLITKQFFKHNE
jgi:hypothetical protein